MKVNKILITTAGLFILAGIIIAGIAIMLTAKSAEPNARMETREISEKISKIDISADMSNIEIIPAIGTDKITLAYFTDDTNKYDISSDNGTLSVKYEKFSKDKAKWYDYFFSFDFKRDHDILLQVPENLIADFQLNTNYGDIAARSITGGSVNIHTNLGDMDIKQCKFKTMECTTDYGDIDIEHCVGDILKSSTDYGDIDMKECVGKLDCGTDYGDIEFKRISGDSILMNTACGNIEGSIDGRETDYTINTKTSLGDNNIQNRTGGEKLLDLKTDMGDIEIIFLK